MNISCSCFVLNWFPWCSHLIYLAHKSIKTKLSNFTQVTSSIIIKNPLKPLKPIKTHLNPLKPTHPPDFLKNPGFGPTLRLYYMTKKFKLLIWLCLTCRASVRACSACSSVSVGPGPRGEDVWRVPWGPSAWSWSTTSWTARWSPSSIIDIR